MNFLFRFLGRGLTVVGFVALGADLLASLERGGFSPYTLALFDFETSMNDSAPVIAAAFTSSSALAGLPISLFSIWIGAVLLAVFTKTGE